MGEAKGRDFMKTPRRYEYRHTILDKNVKKNTPRMFDFRILPSKDRYTQDTSPSPQKTMLKGHRNISGPDLTTLIREGWGEGPP